MNPYDELKDRLAIRWNTRSVLSHVLLLQGIAFNLCVKFLSDQFYLKEALIGRRGVSRDCYYHWGVLLGFMSLIETGYVADWEEPEL